MAGEVITELVGRLSFEVDESGLKKFEQGLGDSKESSEELTTKGVALGTVLGNVATKALELGAALAKHVVAELHESIVVFGESAKELDAWSKRVGAAPEQLQRLEYAAKSLGAEAEDVREGLQTWTENLGELTRLGSGPAADALGSLGLRIEDIKDLAPEESLKVFADALKDLPSEAERTSIAMEVLGTEGSKLRPLLEQGSAGIQELMDKADELGVVLDRSAIDKGLEMNRAFMAIENTTKSVKQTIAVALAPTITDLAERFGEWYAANEDVIEQRIPEVVDAIVEGVTELVHWGQELGRGLDNLAGLFRQMGDEGEDGLGAITELASDAVAFSKAGIEAFVEWTDEVAAMASLVWDVAGAIKDGLVSAYEEYLEPVIDSVTAAMNDQESTLGRVVAFVEDLVDRAIELKQRVSEIVDDLGLERVGQSVGEAARAPARRAQEIIAEQRAAEEEAQRVAQAAQDKRHQAALEKVNSAKNVKQLRAMLAATDDPELRETIERRIRGEKFRKKSLAAAAGGGDRIDTREARRLLGDELGILARGVGASDKAQQAALEAAAKSLEAGDALSVARSAAVSSLGKSTGLDLSGAGGPDAALFQQLTQIGGVTAARSATEGAKFVNIDQSVNVQVGDIRLQIPESYAHGLGSAEIASGVEQALHRALVDRVFSPIVDAQQARSAGP